jgi:hypothetical protein
MKLHKFGIVWKLSWDISSAGKRTTNASQDDGIFLKIRN